MGLTGPLSRAHDSLLVAWPSLEKSWRRHCSNIRDVVEKKLVPLRRWNDALCDAFLSLHFADEGGVDRAPGLWRFSTEEQGANHIRTLQRSRPFSGWRSSCIFSYLSPFLLPISIYLLHLFSILIAFYSSCCCFHSLLLFESTAMIGMLGCLTYLRELLSNKSFPFLTGTIQISE